MAGLGSYDARTEIKGKKRAPLRVRGKGTKQQEGERSAGKKEGSKLYDGQDPCRHKCLLRLYLASRTGREILHFGEKGGELIYYAKGKDPISWPGRISRRFSILSHSTWASGRKKEKSNGREGSWHECLQKKRSSHSLPRSQCYAAAGKRKKKIHLGTLPEEGAFRGWEGRHRTITGRRVGFLLGSTKGGGEGGTRRAFHRLGSLRFLRTSKKEKSFFLIAQGRPGKGETAWREKSGKFNLGSNAIATPSPQEEKKGFLLRRGGEFGEGKDLQRRRPSPECHHVMRPCRGNARRGKKKSL